MSRRRDTSDMLSRARCPYSSVGYAGGVKIHRYFRHVIDYPYETFNLVVPSSLAALPFCTGGTRVLTFCILNCNACLYLVALFGSSNRETKQVVVDLACALAVLASTDYL